MFRKVPLFILLVVWFVFDNSVAVHAQSVKTVTLMTPVLDGQLTFYEAARRLGFYQQEGLKLDLVQTPLSTAIQAVLGGSGDYVKHGSAIGAILGGVPFKVLAVDFEKSPHYIVARPELTSLKDLIGKTIGVDDIAGSANAAVRSTLIKSGIPVDKINFRRMGGPPVRFQGLMAGVIDAAPLNLMFAGRAKEKNFRVLVYTGDFANDVQLAAAAPIEKIQRSSDEVYKFIKASLKARYFQYDNPDEAYKFFLELEGHGDSKLAKDAWEELRMRASKEARVGLLREEAMIESINQWKELMKLEGRPMKVEGRPEDVYDFALSKRAIEELKAEGWDARKYRYVGK